MKNRFNTWVRRIKYSFWGCVVYELYQVLKTTWFSLVSILLGAFALLRVEQAADVIRLLASDSTFWPDIYLFLFLCLWAFCLWYSARLVLRAAGIRALNKSLHYVFHEWAPRVYATLPFIIAARAYALHGEKTLSLGFSLALTALVLLVVYYFKRHRQALLQNISVLYPYRSTTLQNSFQLSRRPVQVFSLLATYLSLLLVIVFIIPSAPSRAIAIEIGPAAIIVFGLSFWTFALSMLAFADHKTKLPVSLLLIALVFGFSFTNNNHLIRTFDTDKKPFTDTRMGMDAHLAAWLHERQEAFLDTTVKEYPVFVVAAEGGGIRAAYWTASVLAELQQMNPAFMKHVYAISSVSGGSLGATVFTGLHADSQQGKLPASPRYLERSRNILKQDFLSPLNAALLFPDMLQRIIPFPIGAWDRSRWLEDAWSEAYNRHAAAETRNPYARMDAPFLDLWSSPRQQLETPALLLNGTRAETGEKVIVSNIKIDHATFGAIDIHGIAGEHIPLKTATLLSARFPLVTPAGALKTNIKAVSTKKLWGSIVDGGYIDNSGLETAMTLVHKLQQRRTQDSARYKKVRVHLLYIKNSSPYSTTEQGHTQSEPISFMYEMRAPIQAFLGSWDQGSEGRIRNTRSYFDRRKAADSTSTGSMILFELDRSKEAIPLGWYLSKSACLAIDVQLRDLYIPGNNGANNPFRKVQDILR